MVRIAHFSDIHISLAPKEFSWTDLSHPKRLLGYLSLKFLRHRSLGASPEIARALVPDILAQKADLIAFTGDLVSISLPAEFDRARACLAPLVERADVLGFPGNHDVYAQDAVDRRLFEERFPAWLRSDEGAGWPRPIIRHLADGVSVVAIRSAWPNRLIESCGHIDRETLWILDGLLRRELLGKTVILALHYGLFRPSGRADSRLHGLVNLDELLEVLRPEGGSRARVAAVIHGHMHRRFALRLPVGTLALCSGSVSDGRRERAYHVLDVEGGGVRVAVRRFNPSTQAFEAANGAEGSGWHAFPSG